MSNTEDVNATPAAVELASANDLDVSEVEGTGEGGKVTVGDVRDHIEAQGDEVTPVDQETVDQLRADAEGSSDLEDAPSGPKPSEEFPPDPELTLDVDRGELDDEELDGEMPALILAGYWVKLGIHDSVPEEHVGAIAWVVSSPWTNAPWTGDSDDTISGYKFDEEAKYVVKLRGSGEEVFEVEADAIQASAQDRPTLLNYA